MSQSLNGRRPTQAPPRGCASGTSVGAEVMIIGMRDRDNLIYAQRDTLPCASNNWEDFFAATLAPKATTSTEDIL